MSITALRWIIIDDLFSVAGSSPSTQPPTEIKLSKMNYTYSNWTKWAINNLYIHTFDTKKKPIDVDKIDVTTNLDSEINIFRLRKGQYKAEVLIKENVSEAKLRILVEYSYKKISEDVIIKLKEPTRLEKIVNEAEKKISKLERFVNWTKEVKVNMFFISFILFISLLGTTTHQISKRKRKIEWTENASIRTAFFVILSLSIITLFIILTHKTPRIARLIDWAINLNINVFFVIIGIFILLLALTTYLIYKRGKNK